MKKTKKSGKLPSGNYRTRISIGKDENGVRKFKSFVAPTKAEADFLAHTYLIQHGRKANRADEMTLQEAYQRYISLKNAVLSPDTVREYTRAAKSDFPLLMHLKLSELTQVHIQNAVNEFSASHSPKTVRNAHGLLYAVVSMFRSDFHFNTTLPKPVQTESYIPSENDLRVLLDALKGSELGKAVMLAAFGSLRRSEIAALTADKIDRHTNVITIDSAMVLSADREWVIKQPKTRAGYRQIEMPKFVIDQLPTEGRVVSLAPSSITDGFRSKLKQIGLQHFRFHDLRHYQASILHAIGVPDKYIMERGGWKTDSTLKNIYQHTLSEQRRKFDDKICDYFSDSYGEVCHEV